MTTPWLCSQRRQDASNMARFLKFCEYHHYDDLYRFSIEDPFFWFKLSEFLAIIWQSPPSSKDKPFRSFDPSMMKGVWFDGDPKPTLNYAENLLESSQNPQDVVLISRSEQLSERRQWTRKDLRQAVSQVGHFLLEQGVKPKDVIFGAVNHSWDTIMLALGVAHIGAVWAGTSSDFGETGLSDRIQSVHPKLIFYHDEYVYQGSTHKNGIWNVLKKKEYEHIPSFSMTELLSVIETSTPKPLLLYQGFAFDHPLFIVFSSGTTGKPKAILHRAGGVLLQQRKELMLHCDLKPKDRLFYFTTCSWMMWHWMLAGLSCQSTIITYAGSPFYSHKEVLLDLIIEEDVSHFGVSPRYLSSLRDHTKDLKPMPSLKTLLLTGAPVYPEHYSYVYNSWKKDIHVISLSGGTDILGCFMIGNPLKPVIPGKIQGPALGMDVKAFDENGKPVFDSPGELVCLKPFPSQPLRFLDDFDDLRYKQAYFDFYPNVWRHGDSITMDQMGMITVHGRSDGTLNPSGVRIGTSEIYSVLEKYPHIQDSICIGWFDSKVKDERVLLFVVLTQNKAQTEDLAEDIKLWISQSLTQRHKPYRVFFVSDIPYTPNQKRMEVPLKKFFSGSTREESGLELISKKIMAEFEGCYRRLLFEVL